MLDHTTLSQIAEDSGAVLNGNTITFADDDLEELAPSVTFSSLETAAREVGEFALNDSVDVQTLLEQAWGHTCDDWSPKEWERYEDTVTYLSENWTKLALKLLLAERAA